MRHLVDDWEPGEFPRWVTFGVKLTLLVLMAVRGMDYYTGDTGNIAANLSEVERAAPLWLWGSVLVFFALFGLVGMLFRQSNMIFIAHLAGWTLYWSLSVGTFTSLVESSRDLSLSHILFAITLLLLATAVGLILHINSDNKYNLYIFIAIGVALGSGVLAHGVDGIRSASGMFGLGTLHMWVATGVAARARQQMLIRKGQV